MTAGQLFYNQPFAEAYLRPGLDIRNWSNRSTYPFVQFVPTGEAEMSQFVQHGRSTYSYVQRYSLRTDGFASIRASLAGGELLTRALKFDGRQLVINYSTSGAGSVRVEIQNRQGIPLPGYTLDDAIRHSVTLLNRSYVGNPAATSAVSRTCRSGYEWSCTMRI